MKLRSAIIALCALALLVPAMSADAQTPLDVECDYARAIAGCRRDVIIVDALPDGAVTYDGHVFGFPAVCAHVGFDQTWCTIVHTAPTAVPVLDVRPAIVVADNVTCSVSMGVTTCTSATTPAQPIPSFTG